MADSTPTRDDLDPEELAANEAADLPSREAMSLIQPGMGLVGGNVFAGPDPPQLIGPPTDSSALPADAPTPPV